MLPSASHIITPDQARTIPGLFFERAARTPDAPAYRFFDALNGIWADMSWAQVARQVRRWRAAFQREGLAPGDRVGIMARNSHLWVIFDLAALSAGLVVVPLFANDRPENAQYILQNAGVKLLVLGPPSPWKRLRSRLEGLPDLAGIVTIAETPASSRKRVLPLAAWLGADEEEADESPPAADPDDLATIIYTSGTTGSPKGVMLSHRNILANAYSGIQAVPVYPSDLFLSFLPLSHALERTIGYYLPIMAGATVAHARGVQELAQDLVEIRPTCLVSVPRIYERIYSKIREELQGSPVRHSLFALAEQTGWRRFEHLQGRTPWSPLLSLWPLLKPLVAEKISQRLGGRLRVALSGGAALSPQIATTFIGLGLPILQGYGLTEAGPVVSVNRLERNLPMSIGPPLPGVEVRIGDDDELLVRGENVMQGYWEDPQATRQAIDPEGWLHTGDRARLEEGVLYLTGRIKEIIVLATGEKIPPADMENAITADPLFEQAMVIGERRPYLSALVVVNTEQWERSGLQAIEDPDEIEQLLLERIAGLLAKFPAYADIKRLTWIREPWTVDNGMLTPILKLKRGKICEMHASDIARMYEGHDTVLVGTLQEAG